LVFRPFAGAGIVVFACNLDPRSDFFARVLKAFARPADEEGVLEEPQRLVIVEIPIMQCNPGKDPCAPQAISGRHRPAGNIALGDPNPNEFRFDLTEEQRRLCEWVARQARIGTRQIRYQEATAALAIHGEQLTRMLKGMRERLDEIHRMVEAPVVHTWTPYFEVPAQARHIWDNYRRAEQAVDAALDDVALDGAASRIVPDDGEVTEWGCPSEPPAESRVLELVQS